MTINEITNKIISWASQYDFINKIWLFGSTAKNKNLTNDIDLAFEITPEPGDDDDIVTWYHCEGAFKNELNKLFTSKVDVVLYNEQFNSKIKNSVDNYGILIYENLE